jgi:hypothetical protein
LCNCLEITREAPKEKSPDAPPNTPSDRTPPEDLV